ncbi:MAG: stage II sporulation protein P [Clostridia bacterium]|nr:stage II sporulation protein P [Clostridia bacterium]
MSQTDLIVVKPRDDNSSSSGVLVQENKKRQKRKRHSLKGFFAILFIALLCFGVYKAFPYINRFFTSLVPNNDSAITDTNSQISDTSSGENGVLAGDENTNTPDIVIPSGHYQIVDLDTKEYEIINESRCEFDFSVPFEYTSLEKIYSTYGKDAPVVLIIHSSNRECYSDGISYSPEGAFYSDTKNVGDIGEIICENLNKIGVNAIHINETYAGGNILSSKEEYESSLQKALNKYPSISYVFNISRDVQINSDLSMDKSTLPIGDEASAQIGIICGTSDDFVTKDQNENVRFAFDFASRLNEKGVKLIKSNTISRFSLSQNYQPICLKIDIGSYANSFEEASLCAEAFAFYISEYIK